MNHHLCRKTITVITIMTVTTCSNHERARLCECVCVRARVHFFDFLFPKDITVRGHVAIDVCVPVRDASSPASTVCTTAANCCCRPLLATDSAKTRRCHPVDDTHTHASIRWPIRLSFTVLSAENSRAKRFWDRQLMRACDRLHRSDSPFYLMIER